MDRPYDALTPDQMAEWDARVRHEEDVRDGTPDDEPDPARIAAEVRAALVAIDDYEDVIVNGHKHSDGTIEASFRAVMDARDRLNALAAELEGGR